MSAGSDTCIASFQVFLLVFSTIFYLNQVAKCIMIMFKQMKGY